MKLQILFNNDTPRYTMKVHSSTQDTELKPIEVKVVWG